jgi:multimeric flavodoxin WrbA
MAKNIVVLQASPKKDGNTAALAGWFAEGARRRGAAVEIIGVATLKFKANGCTSCRLCQSSPLYECAVKDGAAAVLAKMASADVIAMATPLYFFGPSAQLKLVLDRAFSLYKWDNAAGRFTTPLRGKLLVLIASAYEDVGLDALERPFRLTAEYTGMGFKSLLVPNAGVSGDIKDKSGPREKAAALGEWAARG